MKPDQSIYDCKHYKPYLSEKAGPRHTRRGVRGAMARVLNCQPTYISQVLYGKPQLSLEQGEMLSEFFGHTPEEKHYFLLLIQKDRAGTKRLEKYFADQVEQVLAKRLVLKERFGFENQLTSEDQSIYYSSWHYAAIHIALTVPELRTPRKLALNLQISLRRVAEVLDFLCRAGLALRSGDSFMTGTTRIGVGNSSHNIIKHHTNWRNQAIESLDRETLSELHYSAVVTLSREDAAKIRDKIADFIQTTVKTIRESKEEELYGYCIDFFDLKKIQA